MAGFFEEKLPGYPYRYRLLMMKSRWSQDLYMKAYYFAAHAHKNQMVPGSDLPYIVHVNLVSMEIMAALVVETEKNGDLAVPCALLHDVIEDTETTVEQVKVVFGSAVARGVNALSKNKSIKKEDRLIDSIKRIKTQPEEIWMVKLADRITNLQPPPSHWTTNKIIHYLKQAEEIHEALKDASDFLSLRLEKKMAEYKTHIDTQT